MARAATERASAAGVSNGAVRDVTRAELQELGKEARKRVPRSSHAAWEPWPGRPDPVELLEQQAVTRVPELVPIRYGRMLASPFAFFRGAALQMASDLAHTPDSGLRVQACGDAHLANFGGFASPERELLFDVNDFDETLPGPWEWDVKRLGASMAVAGRARGFSAAQRRKILVTTVARYRIAMRRFAGEGNLAVWYAALNTQTLQIWGATMKASRRRKLEAVTQAAVQKAETKDSMKAFRKLTTVVDGQLQIVSDPPLIVRAADLLPAGEAEAAQERMHEMVRRYRTSLQPDRRHLLEGYRLVDVARKVVGVGSVGTRCWIALFEGRASEQDPLFLQMKEAEASVLERFVGASEFTDNHGRRVVEGQRTMQSASDIFLGWLDNDGGLDGVERDFYVRQLWDWKFSANIDAMDPDTMLGYGEMCAWTLARAHARTGDRVAIASYLGNSDQFEQAIAQFAEAYADQSERDHAALQEAAKSGRVKAETGV